MRAELSSGVGPAVASTLGLEKMSRILNAKEREIVAHHEMGQALVALSSSRRLTCVNVRCAGGATLAA